MKQMYEWQKNAVAKFARAAYFALVVDCGCGKTFGAIKIALAKMLPTIVIAPTHTLCEQWKNDIIADGEASEDDVWVYSKPEETKGGEKYRERFLQWLAK